jgi:uncharacterized circularly permuted ATP-grasp superfamily protein/uncharacterized alpha-E superfamily protein
MNDDQRKNPNVPNAPSGGPPNNFSGSPTDGLSQSGGPSGQLQSQGMQFQQQQQQASSAVDREAAGVSKSGNFFKQYSAPPTGFNEHLDAGKIRPHCAGLNDFLSQIGPEGMDRRMKQIRRLVYQNGIVFSSYGDPTVRENHLQLDLIPQLLHAAEWSKVKIALSQRADLLDRVLTDLSGPRQLIQRGVIPQDLLFRHPHYQVPYQDLPPVSGRHLHLYAAELIRSPKGDWWVMSDRTDSPGGWGFALENRLAISRAFPAEFRRSNVERLASYFIALREHLKGLALTNRDDPHIAVLSAGTGSKSYFEDSYLARYLGFTLVEDKDLVVRSNRVMLKTLAGLTRIDVILRRQQGNQIDPLESGSHAPGISGILQAAREGNVAIVNSPGSGLVESPVFMAFMPRICKALLGTELLLPGVATWWAGEKASRELIIDRIDDLELKPAYRQRTVLGSDDRFVKAVDPERLSRAERIKLIEDEPRDWVAQERVERSSAAIWQDGKLQTGYISMRSFLVASGEGWKAMPGGLVRVSENPHEPIGNPFEGGGAKDAWVINDKPTKQVSLLRGGAPVYGSAIRKSRSGGHLSSRMADNLCWLGRYFERTDAAARLLRSVVSRLTGENDPADLVELPVLIRALASDGRIDPMLAIEEVQTFMPTMDSVLSRFTLDRNDPNTLRSLVDLLVSQAAKVREGLSSDAWRTIKRVSDNFESDRPESCSSGELLDLTNDLILNLASFSGLINESMTRNFSLCFLNIGRRIEHSLQVISLLKNTLLHDGQMSSGLLEAILQTSDSIMTYRARYFANFQPAAILDLLLVDESNPRSLAFQLVQLEENLGMLPAPQETSGFARYQRLAMDALHRIRMVDIFKLGESYSKGMKEPLVETLAGVERVLPDVYQAVSNQFLIHSGPTRQLVMEPFGKLPTQPPS